MPEYDEPIGYRRAANRIFADFIFDNETYNVISQSLRNATIDIDTSIEYCCSYSVGEIKEEDMTLKRYKREVYDLERRISRSRNYQEQISLRKELNDLRKSMNIECGKKRRHKSSPDYRKIDRFLGEFNVV